MQQEIELSLDEAVASSAALFEAGRVDDAELLLRNVVKYDPDHAHAQNWLGTVLSSRKGKSLYEALYRFDRALKLNPTSGIVRSNIGMVLSELGHQQEALALLRKAVQIAPERAAHWSNLGIVLTKVEDYEEAETSLLRALEIEPSNPLSLHSLGTIVTRRPGGRRKAIEYYDEAIRLDPTYPDAYYNRGVARLSLGEYWHGFKDYEYRLKCCDHVYYCGPFKEPKWTGLELIEHKTVLVHGEQGLGDCIQFMRYLPRVLALGAKVVMVLHSALRPFVQAQFPQVTVLEPGADYPPFDYWVPLMSLAACFGTTLETVPPPWPIKAEAIPLFRASSKPNIGLCWAGNYNHKNNHHRSAPLSVLRPLIDDDRAYWVSLQKDIADSDQPYVSGLEQWPLKDMADTASMIAALDLVITVDTMIAHLAASMGKETWIMLPWHGTDWRWLLDREDSPWYPTVRLFRQPAEGDWASVVNRVHAAVLSLQALEAA